MCHISPRVSRDLHSTRTQFEAEMLSNIRADYTIRGDKRIALQVVATAAVMNV